jgi:hypothetical protein
VSRVLVLVQRPYHLTDQESEQWLHSQAAEFAQLGGVRSVDVVRLESASWKFAREGDWLLELHIERGEHPARILNEPTCVALLADLRVLGMRPSVAVLGVSGGSAEDH